MCDQDTYNNVSGEEFRNNLKSVLQTYTKYLTEQQNEILQHVFARQIVDYSIELPKGRKEAHRGLLTNIEWKNILKDVIPYKKMDTSFEYADE